MASTKLIVCLLVSAFLAACATTTVPPEMAESVIDSVMTDPSRNPWRLGASWRDGGLGGAALRASAIEHVITQRELQRPSRPVSLAANKVEVFPLSEGFGAEETERAWRKFCRHGLDMTARDHEIVSGTDMPPWLSGQCYTESVYK